MNELETSYISKISLKNYKSIRDLTIDLHPGLNIMIGQNGSGKTNFVQAIQSVLSESLHHELPIGFGFEFEFTNHSDKLTKKWKGSIKEVSHKTIQGKKIKIYESKLGKIKKAILFHPDIMNELPSLESIIIPFSLPNELPYLKQMNSVEIHEYYITYETQKHPLEESLGLHLLVSLSVTEEFYYFNTLQVKVEQQEVTLNNLKAAFRVNDNLKKQLKRFSPIKDCRLASGYSIETQGKGFIINHVILEFFVNNNWHSWNHLSDGTKRLFYIISQTLNNQALVIIEEPELGLHPDQLFGIMDFFKEQSKYKQIIVTTHSPDALNILEKDELHKIVITRFDTKKGTLMHHLSPQKVAKAHRYMNTEGLELKDFWLHSNLEELDDEN